MMNKTKFFMFVAGVLVTSPAVASEDGHGVYLALRGGAADAANTGYSSTVDVPNGEGTTAVDIAGHVGTNSSGTAVGSIGYDFGLVRADVEVSYARNRIKSVAVDSLAGSAVTTIPADVATAACPDSATCSVSGNTISFSGRPKVRQLNALTNLWIDLPIVKILHPYIGGGIGVSAFESDGSGKGKFAWQLGAGLAFDVTRHIAITADYRRLQTDQLGDAFGSGVEYGRTTTNSYTAGIRFRL